MSLTCTTDLVKQFTLRIWYKALKPAQKKESKRSIVGAQ